MPTHLLPDVDRLLAALSLLALLLYLTPAVSSLEISESGRRRLQWAAVLTLVTGVAIALAATAMWFAE